MKPEHLVPIIMAASVCFSSIAPVSAQTASNLRLEAERRLEQQRALNSALAERIADLERQLEIDLCKALETTGESGCVIPSSLIDFKDPVIQSAPGSDTQASEASTPETSVPDNRLVDAKPPIESPPEQQLASAPARLSSLNLLNKLEGASGFVILPETGSIGTGFFIAPGIMITNNHVVGGDGGNGTAVLVTSKTIGQPYQARIVALSRGSDFGSDDFALLSIPELAGTHDTLTLSTSYNKLDAVLAAGYPGIVVNADQAFVDLVEGDSAASPDLVINEGRVSALQDAEGGGTVIVHSADISQGNSGGPLIDACGRVIGINTFITADQENASRASFALGSDKILQFLRSVGIGTAVSDEYCPGE